MMNRSHVIQFVGLLTALVGAAGCTGFNQFASTVDMKVTHVAETTPCEYEGSVGSIQKVSHMTSIKFAGNGPMYDVDEAPVGLLQGDIVRIYKTKSGYVAHLWHRPETSSVTDTIPPKTPAARRS